MCEGKTGEERDLGIFKDNPMNNHINGELSTRPFHWYVVDKSLQK